MLRSAPSALNYGTYFSVCVIVSPGLRWGTMPLRHTPSKGFIDSSTTVPTNRPLLPCPGHSEVCQEKFDFPCITLCHSSPTELPAPLIAPGEGKKRERRKR
jgi:hypothetical protein